MATSPEWEYGGNVANTPLGVVDVFVTGFNESAAPTWYWEDLLFHYTRRTGFLGILKSRQIWASHASSLNDASEINYPYEVLTATLQRLRLEAQSGIIQAFLSGMEARTAALPSVFVASFTKEGDRRTQWPIYSKVGDGYSLGFESFLPPGALLLEVEYSREQQEARLEERIRRIIGLLNWLDGLGRSAEQRERALQVCLEFVPDSLWVSLLGFKHPGFYEEKEWRWCYLEPKPGEGRLTLPVQVRDTEKGKVRYVEFALSESDAITPRLREVVVAPGADADARKASAEEALREFGFDQTLVRTSSLPLRS